MRNLIQEYALGKCMEGLHNLIVKRLRELKGEPNEEKDEMFMEAMGLAYLPILPQKEIQLAEGVLLSLALFPYIRPQLFDRALQEVFPKGGNFPEMGGIRLSGHQGFLPTGTTAVYLLAGDDLKQRFYVQSLFSSDYWLAQKGILTLDHTLYGTPSLDGRLILDQDFVEKLTLGTVSKPKFSSEFPAVFIETQMTWKNLVLMDKTKTQINDILKWLKHHRILRDEWDLGHQFKPGFRALFHGPPGTGKTLAATLLGKYTKRDVFKIDLSTVVSKYIGETEKNLANLFDGAENKDWILFFDEADALFGKRTQVQNAHDRYANQEVSYLLQRIESFHGLVILASNLKSNIDTAFLRRFQSIIYFPIPKAFERQQLWESTLPKQITLDTDVSLKYISQKYELTGADILNIVQDLCIQGLADDNLIFSKEFIEGGIRKELLKGNKIG